jgi:hypothetical protein
MRMTYGVVFACAFSVYCGGGGGGGGGGPMEPLPNPPAPPGSQTVFEYSSPLGDFAIYLPPGTSTYRGVLLSAPGFSGDTRMIADRRFPGGLFDNHAEDFDGPHFQAYRTRILALAQKYGLAVMGGRLPTNATAPDRLGNLLSAMAALATESQHPELATAPFLFDGLSAGGQFAYAFTRLHPERVIGFWTQKGGLHDIRDGLAARQVPGFLVIGGTDTKERCLNLTALFDNNRPAGALWALAVEPGAGHTRVLDADLQFHWMDAVLASRLPAAGTPGAPVVLRSVSEGSGWLGDRETAAVAQFDAYDNDKAQASWLPSAQVAEDWSAFVAPGRPLECPADPPPPSE